MSTIAAGLTSTNALVNTGDTSGQLVFQTNGTTTAMTIDTSQKVGIGTNSPSSLLHVYSSTTTAVSKTEVNTSVGNVARLELKSPVADYGWYVADNANALVLYDYNASAARMVIDSSGNVGIGTSSPTVYAANDKVLQIDSGANGGAIRISNTTTGANGGFLNYQLGLNSYLYNISAGFLAFGTSNAEKMRIDASGNVLIGTTTAQGRMTVVGSSGNVALYTSMNTADGSGLYNVNANSGSYFTIQSNGSNGYGVSGWANSTVLEAVPASTGGLVLSSYTGNMIFQVGTGRTERMRIDSSGNVGIGTASPTVKLSIYNSTTDTDVLTISNPSTNADAQQHYVGMIFGDNAQGYGNSSAIRSYSNLYATYGSTLRFYTTANTGLGLVERMQIDSSGNLLVNCTSTYDNARLSVNTPSTARNGISVATGNGNGYTCFQAGINYVADFYSYFKYGSTTTGYIKTTNGTDTVYASISDYRLKENVQPMTGALEKVQQLNPVTYEWKTTGKAGQGFIAHELQAIVPDCVTGEKDAVDEEGKPIYQGIDTSFLVATLTASIQELKAIVDAQAERIAVLEAK